MERTEMITIMQKITSLYPNFRPADMSATVDIWMEVIGEADYEAVYTALMMYARTDRSGFAPSPAQLIGVVMDAVTANTEMNDSEAWAIVRKAISCGIYRSEESFNKMPEVIQRAIGGPEQIRIWAIDPEFNEGVVQSNFQRTYRAELERQRQRATMPDNLQKLVKVSMKQLEAK